MSTVTYLSNPVVTINNVVLTDQTTAATVTHRFDQLEATAFGDTDRKYVKGLGNHEITLSMYMSTQRQKPTPHCQVLWVQLPRFEYSQPQLPTPLPTQALFSLARSLLNCP